MLPTRDDILDVLRTIPDPEMPISIVDLGIVERVDVLSTEERVPSTENNTRGTRSSVLGTSVAIDILPTFVGCPALPMIEEQVREKVAAMPGVGSVDVQFVFDPPWSVDRITEAGRAALKSHGVTVPECGGTLRGPTATVELRTSAVACPFCNSTSTRLDSPFGPTRCRMIYYCEACRNSFEHMKKI